MSAAPPILDNPVAAFSAADENRPKKHLTLLLLKDDARSRVLLGMKKRGFGEGWWNGFGGKVEPGETILEGALREMEEESGVKLPSASYRAHITFEFEGKEELLSVNVFWAIAPSDLTDTPAESEEMRPAWFDYSTLPLDKMWVDDRYWLPRLLAGECFRARFVFRGQGEITGMRIDEVDEACWAGEASRIPVPAGSIAQASIPVGFGNESAPVLK